MTQRPRPRPDDREDEPQRSDVPEGLAREAHDEIEGVVEELREAVVRRPGVARRVAHIDRPDACAAPDQQRAEELSSLRQRRDQARDGRAHQTERRDVVG